MEKKKSIVAVVAHTGDFVWRCAGALAVHVERGDRVKVICLSYGERGEAGALWKDPAMTGPKARQIRKDEAIKAAAVLGCEIEFFDGDDYMLRTSEQMLERAIAVYREMQVDILLTHSRHDPGNLDHEVTFRLTLEARQSAQAAGRAGGKLIGEPEKYGMTIGAPQVYSFEPHQSELCDFKPDTFVDISAVWEKKWAAMQCIASQGHMYEYYVNMAERRAALGKWRPTHAEAFQRIFPTTVRALD